MVGRKIYRFSVECPSCHKISTQKSVICRNCGNSDPVLETITQEYGFDSRTSAFLKCRVCHTPMSFTCSCGTSLDYILKNDTGRKLDGERKFRIIIYNLLIIIFFVGFIFLIFNASK